MMATMNGNGQNGRPLPDGWGWTTINEVADFIRGVTYKKGDASETPKKGFLPILRATNIQDNKLITNEYLVFVPEKYVKIEQLLKSGDVVVCMSSGSKHLVGKTARLENDWVGSFGTFCGGLRFKPDVNSKFGAYYFQSPYYREFIREKSSGININNLRFTDFETLEISLPPLPEQERIVNRIEELLSDLDAGVAALERVQIGLQRYKVSVLKAAVEGRLFGNVEVGDDGLLPGWSHVTIDDVAESLDNKRVPVNKTERAKRHGQYPYYGANGQVDSIDDYIFDEPLVLVVEDETFTGREKPFSYKITGKTWVNNHAHVLKAKENILDVDYLNYSLAYYPFTPMTTGTTGRKKLTKSVLMAAPYLLPPLDEQRRIVAEVERRLSVVGEVESAVEVGLVRAGRLRQSVLRSAFEGRL